MTMITTPGSGSIPVPAGKTKCQAQVWAAGGAGGSMLGGGGGGYMRNDAIAVTDKQTIFYSVGHGGVSGGPGEGTTVGIVGFNPTIVAFGGQGGGNGGAGGGASGNGDHVHSGGAGGPGAGGGAARAIIDGQDGDATTGGSFGGGAPNEAGHNPGGGGGVNANGGHGQCSITFS